MTTSSGWPVAEPLTSRRLTLEPLSLGHAAAMVAVLGDPALYEFTGGEPPTLGALSDRFARQAVGHSASGDQGWLNWVVALDGALVGYVQATVVRTDVLEAEIAWVLAPEHQGRGLATEAASAMVGWLAEAGVRRVVAHIHPQHAASAAVAARLGLHATDVVEDGELRWVATL